MVLPHAESQMHLHRVLEFMHRGKKKTSMLVLKWNCYFKILCRRRLQGEKIGVNASFSIHGRNFVLWKRSPTNRSKNMNVAVSIKDYDNFTHRCRDKGKTLPSLALSQCHFLWEKSVILPHQLSFMLPAESFCKESLDS